jgi:hypothetical protein
MKPKLLQMDYFYAGPWGHEMSAAYAGLAERIADVPGLVWKIWTENRDEGIAGGIYLFENEELLNEYFEGKISRLEAARIQNLRAKKFDVNMELSSVTRFKEWCRD